MDQFVKGGVSAFLLALYQGQATAGQGLTGLHQPYKTQLLIIQVQLHPELIPLEQLAVIVFQTQAQQMLW